MRSLFIVTDLKEGKSDPFQRFLIEFRLIRKSILKQVGRYVHTSPPRGAVPDSKTAKASLKPYSSKKYFIAFYTDIFEELEHMLSGTIPTKFETDNQISSAYLRHSNYGHCFRMQYPVRISLKELQSSGTNFFWYLQEDK